MKRKIELLYNPATKTVSIRGDEKGRYSLTDVREVPMGHSVIITVTWDDKP